MYQSSRVHRTYKEHNRWMYVAPVRERIGLWSILEGLGIGFAMGTLMIAVSVVLVMPLIG